MRAMAPGQPASLQRPLRSPGVSTAVAPARRGGGPPGRKRPPRPQGAELTAACRVRSSRVASLLRETRGAPTGLTATPSSPQSRAVPLEADAGEWVAPLPFWPED